MAYYSGIGFYLGIGQNNLFNLVHDPYRELHITSGCGADGNEQGTRVFIGN